MSWCAVHGSRQKTNLQMNRQRQTHRRECKKDNKAIHRAGGDRTKHTAKSTEESLAGQRWQRGQRGQRAERAEREDKTTVRERQYHRAISERQPECLQQRFARRVEVCDVGRGDTGVLAFGVVGPRAEEADGQRERHAGATRRDVNEQANGKENGISADLGLPASKNTHASALPVLM